MKLKQIQKERREKLKFNIDARIEAGCIARDNVVETATLVQSESIRIAYEAGEMKGINDNENNEKFERRGFRAGLERARILIEDWLSSDDGDKPSAILSALDDELKKL